MENLKSNDTDINPLGSPITVYEESLITSLHGIGLGVGPLFLGKLADLFGRKRSLLLFSILEVLGFLLLTFSRHIYLYYLARVIQGFCFGFFTTVMPVFIAEISDDTNRGRFATFVSMFITLGNVYGFVMTLIFDMKAFTVICAVPGIITIVLFYYFIPESPIYLAWKQKPVKAKESLQKFRNLNFTETEKIFNEIKQICSSTESLTCTKFLEIRKSLYISIGLFIIAQLTGLFAILGYLSSILPLSISMSSIAVGITHCLAILLSSVLIEKYGRRILLLISLATVFSSLFVLGTYFHLEILKLSFISYMGWFPALIVVTFIMGFGIGISCVPFAIVGEIFPTNMKAIAASLSLFVAGCANFIIVFTFPICRDTLGLDWCFWILGFMSLLGYIFIFISVPETKGKSFSEIQEMINGKSQ